MSDASKLTINLLDKASNIIQNPDAHTENERIWALDIAGHCIDFAKNVCDEDMRTGIPVILASFVKDRIAHLENQINNSKEN